MAANGKSNTGLLPERSQLSKERLPGLWTPRRVTSSSALYPRTRYRRYELSHLSKGRRPSIKTPRCSSGNLAFCIGQKSKSFNFTTVYCNEVSQIAHLKCFTLIMLRYIALHNSDIKL
jgi:hypothetical protein